MLMSMTGFSTRTITLPIHDSSVTFTLTLKSVNGRYFETTCKLPYALSHLEHECIKLFKMQLIRGSLYFTVYVSQLSALKGTVRPNISLAQSYVEGLKAIQAACNLEGSITINDLVLVPHIFELPDETLDEQTTQLFMKQVQPLLNDLVAERLREGTALVADFMQRIDVLRKHVHQIEPRAQELMAQRKKTLLAEIQPLLQHMSDESREQQLLTVYQQLEKMDIHEEVVRFKTHLDNLEAIILNNEIEKGKRLDFTLQELFREINTMSAKSSDAQISASTIAMKVEVEKAREQVQNIV